MLFGVESHADAFETYNRNILKGTIVRHAWPQWLEQKPWCAVELLKQHAGKLGALPVDTSSTTGKAFFDMLEVFAEFETSLRRERQAEGIAAAKQRGAYRGRTPTIDRDAIRIAHKMGISRGTVYKAKGVTTPPNTAS